VVGGRKNDGRVLEGENMALRETNPGGRERVGVHNCGIGELSSVMEGGAIAKVYERRGSKAFKHGGR